MEKKTGIHGRVHDRIHHGRIDLINSTYLDLKLEKMPLSAADHMGELILTVDISGEHLGLRISCPEVTLTAKLVNGRP